MRKNLQVLAPQAFSHSGTVSAASSTWYILAGIPVGLYLQSLPVGKGLFSEAKRRDMDRLAAAAFNALWS